MTARPAYLATSLSRSVCENMVVKGCAVSRALVPVRLKGTGRPRRSRSYVLRQPVT